MQLSLAGFFFSHTKKPLSLQFSCPYFKSSAKPNHMHVPAYRCVHVFKVEAIYHVASRPHCICSLAKIQAIPLINRLIWKVKGNGPHSTQTWPSWWKVLAYFLARVPTDRELESPTHATLLMAVHTELMKNTTRLNEAPEINKLMAAKSSLVIKINRWLLGEALTARNTNQAAWTTRIF